MADIKQGMGGTGEKKVNTGPNWQRILTPIFGFILILLGGIVSYILSKPITDALRKSISNFPQQDAIQIVVAIGIFLILLLVLYIVYAAIAPRPKATVSEKALDKEKKEKQEEQLRIKKRNAEMKQKMRQANRKKNE